MLWVCVVYLFLVRINRCFHCCLQVVSLEVRVEDLIQHCESTLVNQTAVAKRLRRAFSLHDNKDRENNDNSVATIDDSGCDGEANNPSCSSSNNISSSINNISSSNNSSSREAASSSDDVNMSSDVQRQSGEEEQGSSEVNSSL